MSADLRVIIKRLGLIFIVVAVLFGISLLFSYDVIKLNGSVLWDSLRLCSRWSILFRSRPSPSRLRDRPSFRTLAFRKSRSGRSAVARPWCGAFPDQLLCLSWAGWQRRWNGLHVPAKQTRLTHQPCGSVFKRWGHFYDHHQWPPRLYAPS